MQKLSSIKPALLATLIVFVTAVAGQFQAANAQGAAPPLASAIKAREVLAQIDRARIDRIPDAAVRAQLRRGYDALQAVARNTSRTSEKVLLARVHNIALKFPPTSRRERRAKVGHGSRQEIG